MGEETSKQLTVAERRELTQQLVQLAAVRHPPREEPALSLYPEWTSHISHERINGLVAAEDELWAATSGGVVRWHWDGDTVAYTRYSSEHGLPGSRFDCIGLDSRGRPWVGGHAMGLSYLDGSHWNTMTLEQGLPALDAYCLTTAPDGTLWAGTANGIGRVSLEGRTPRWQPYDLSYADLPADEVRALTIEPDGTLWLGTSWGLYGYQPLESSWRRYTVADGLTDNEVGHLVLGHDGRLWIGAAQGLCVFHRGQFLPVAPVEGAVWSLAVGSGTGTLWAVVSGNLWRHDGKEWFQRMLASPWEKHVHGRTVATNGRGRVWVGLKRGLMQLEPEYQLLFGQKDSEMPSGGVTALAIDPQRRVWAGNESGLWVWSENAWRRLRVGNELGSPMHGVESIVVSPTGEVWAGSWVEGQDGGLRCFVDGIEMTVALPDAPTCVDAMTFGSDGHLWVASQGFIFEFDGQKWNRVTEYPDPSALVHTLLVDTDGRLWWGSTVGLHCYQDGIWNEWIARVEVNALVQDATSKIWIGTSLALRYIEGETVGKFEGNLPSKNVLALAAPGADDLWIGTLDGLARFQHGKISVWQAENSGLSENHIRALAPNGHGMMWIGTANGISRLDLCHG